MAYEKLVKEILKDVGGKENINGLTHCITRLRFNLKDEEKANTEELKEAPGVVTVVQSGGQYQVVIGNHVPDVYKEFIELSGLSTETEVVKEKKGLLDSFIDIISGIFTPVLGLLAATGMIKGLNVLFVSLGWITNTSGTYAILQAAGDCFFYFFPIFLGYTAAKKFGLNQFVGMALGAALVYPTIAGLTTNADPLYTLFSGTIFESPVYITFLGIPVILMSYGSSVIPIVVSTFFGSKLEKSLARIIPSILKSFLVPFLTVIIMVPLTFIIIGPIATWAGDLLGEFVLTIYNFSPIVAGIAVGAIWQVLVMFGLHWGIIPIAINNISVLGYDPVMVLGQATPFATAGAVLAVIIKSRNVSVRAIGIPAFISSFFGVSEPSLYGVTLPRKKPFIATLISASVGGLIMGIFGTKSFIMGGMGIFSLPNYISPESGIGNGFYGYVLAIVVAFVLSFILTLTFLYDPKEDREAQRKKENEKDKEETRKSDLMTEVVVPLPIAGEVLPLSEIDDAAFSTGLLGKGLAVRPNEGKVYAPFDGTVETLFPTNHAIGLKSVDGIELLIHIGMDTVNLEGKYFVPKVKQEDTIKKGQLLLEFDGKAMQEAGYSIDTPIVVTNTKEYLDVLEKVKEKELIIIK
ncbi:beta-glucoside-specific PTS transporter subunit IIABC [Enterococcus faecium]|uniref:beta-glucoside-specific PTS transporter subunit IIABC n=1 Tax=Enterococcus faecium TaxID=1352 RepID=UPI0023B33E07|nr:beta-glucoside-specific PTS transporter subunit IIABC [Enterococcus faecium]